MVNKIKIATNAAPPATGTYSQAIRTGDLVFLTGQTGRDPNTGKLEEGLEAQTRRLLKLLDDEPLWSALAALADELLAHETLDEEQVAETLAAWLD